MVGHMRINFIIPFKRMSGGIRVIYIYANYLVSKGHDVCCYLPAVSYPGKGQNALFRLKASLSNVFKPEHWYDCKFAVKVVPCIKDCFIRDADVTIASAWQTAFDVNILSKKKGDKFYFVQDLETFNGEEEIINESFRLPLNIITITSELKKHILRYNTSVSLVYNGLFSSEFISQEKPRGQLFKILFFYHEAPTKGTRDGLEVIRSLHDEGFSIEGVVFGRKITESFPHYINAFQNPSRDQLMKLYREADVYLFTSYHDAWGLTVAEAAANKCAIIGRKIGIIDELYDGNNFLVVNDSIEMLEMVKKLYKDRALLMAYQERSYETVKKLKWERSCETFERIIMTKNRA